MMAEKDVIAKVAKGALLLSSLEDKKRSEEKVWYLTSGGMLMGSGFTRRRRVFLLTTSHFCVVIAFLKHCGHTIAILFIWMSTSNGSITQGQS
jgi:hypothetical protein